jgi:hypothetical protein
MQLLTASLAEAFRRFPLHSQDAKGEGALVVCKFFDPCGRYTFFVTEGEPVSDHRGPVLTEDGEPEWDFFGYCLSPLGEDCDEWGYVTLSELRSVRGHLGLGIERDLAVLPGKKTVASFTRRSTTNTPAPDTNS